MVNIIDKINRISRLEFIEDFFEKGFSPFYILERSKFAITENSISKVQ